MWRVVFPVRACRGSCCLCGADMSRKASKRSERRVNVRAVVGDGWMFSGTGFYPCAVNQVAHFLCVLRAPVFVCVCV